MNWGYDNLSHNPWRGQETGHNNEHNPWRGQETGHNNEIVRRELGL